jgi:hypothetical protein
MMLIPLADVLVAKVRPIEPVVAREQGKGGGKRRTASITTLNAPRSSSVLKH